MIAEDDIDIANLHKLILESRGHTVVLALDGQKCLDSYRQTKDPFDAVVLDYKMPKLNGIQVAKEIVRLNPEQRVLLATAVLKETLADCIKDIRRIVEMIQKPFEPESLIQIVEDKSILAKLQKLNASMNEAISDSHSPSNNEVEKLLRQLKNIQKPGTI